MIYHCANYGNKKNQGSSFIRDLANMDYTRNRSPSPIISKIGQSPIKRMKIKNKKAQIKIQQMAFMLLAVTLFFVLAGMVVLVIRFAGLKETASILEGENSMLLVSKLANSPEFSCENAYGALTNCVDYEKVISLKGNKNYEDFWGVAKIEIRKIYPAGTNIKCNANNFEECGIIEILSKNVPSLPSFSNFVTLCAKVSAEATTYNKCELAKLIVSSENKENA